MLYYNILILLLVVVTITCFVLLFVYNFVITFQKLVVLRVRVSRQLPVLPKEVRVHKFLKMKYFWLFLLVCVVVKLEHFQLEQVVIQVDPSQR